MPEFPGNSTDDDPGHAPLYYEETDNLASELNISPGDILQARVVSRMPGEKSRLLLNLRGRQVVAATRINVAPGDSLIVKVQSVSHPVELKIFEPGEALQKLSREQLSGILRDMQLEPTEQLLEAANQLLKEDIHLDDELLQLARNHWDKLSESGEKIQPGRFRALRFLYDLDAPINEDVLKFVGDYIGGDEPSVSWHSALDGGRLVSLENFKDFYGLIQGLGIDIVRQLGKKPCAASQTLHARLLRQQEKNENQGPGSALLGYLLSLALGSLANENEFYLSLPLFTGEEMRELKLWIKIGDSPEDWSIPDWSLSGYFPFECLEAIRFDINCSRRRLGCIFTAADGDIMQIIKNNTTRLLQTLEEGGYNVQLKFKQETPEPPPGPLARDEETQIAREGKVNFLA